MKIFISYSSKDEELTTKFASFLESLDDNISVFCDTISIAQGKDYVQTIDEELTKCDMFIPLISENYFESKYAMIELGFAYSFLSMKKKENHIFPFSIPPLEKEKALLSTPLSRIQVRELNTGIHAFVKQLKKEKKISKNYLHNNDINIFISDIEKIILKNLNVFNQAIILPICSEGERKESIKISKDGNNYTVTLIPLENGKYDKYPSFLSCVFKFPKKINLYPFLAANNNAVLQFNLNTYTDSIEKIDVEFKFSDSIQLFKKDTFNIVKGINRFNILFNEMDINGLKNISEICFVVWNSYLKESEGTYCIEDLKIVF